MTQDDFEDDLGTPTEDDLAECYGSKYLGAVDIGNRKIRTRIAKITKELMPSRDGKPARNKFVLYLANLNKPLVLNATNKNRLVDALGAKPAGWINAEIGILAEDTQFGGKATKGLRLKVISAPKAAAKATAKPASKPAATEELPWPDEDGDPGPEFTEAAE
jgi:hypothetical protein